LKFSQYIEWLNERKNETLEYGCIMLKANVKDWKEKISIVREEDLYVKENDYGYEKEPHVTVLYGLHDDEVEIDELHEELQKMRPFRSTIDTISIFETEDYDVVKFEVPVNEELKKYRERFLKFPNTQTYSEYHPHMTIAYVEKGKGKKYVSKVEPFEVEFREAIYSPASGIKEYFDLGQLNEKFIEDSDPVHDLNIGYEIINFSKERKKIIKNHQYSDIANVNKAVDLLNSLIGKKITGTFYLPASYKRVKCSFVIKYRQSWTCAETIEFTDKDDNVYRVIPEKDYYISRDKIYEKFTQDSDPIHDMGIGIEHFRKIWAKHASDIGIINSIQFEKKYKIPKEYQWWPGSVPDITYIIFKTLDDAARGEDLQKAFYSICKIEGALGKKHLKFRIYTAKILQKHFSASVDPYFRKKKKLNEKFIEDSDPIADMNIGFVSHVKSELAKIINDPEYWLGKKYNSKNENLIWLCIRYEKFEWAKILIKNKIGNSAAISACAGLNHALQWAVYHKHIPLIKLLLKAGANPRADSNRPIKLVNGEDGASDKKIYDILIAHLNNQSVNEKFVQDSDPVHDLGIGLTHIIKLWLDEHKIKNYKINNDFTIDVDSDIDLSAYSLKSLPLYIKFGTVNGNFFCNNESLTSLRGFPQKIFGLLGLGETKIKSLKSAPTSISNTLFVNSCKYISRDEIIKYLKRAKNEDLIVSSDYGDFVYVKKYNKVKGLGTSEYY